MKSKIYEPIVQHYERCLATHGISAQGMDWPNEQDLQVRFSVMYEIIRSKQHNDKISLLDLGCGGGLFYDYIKKHDQLGRIKYHGIDLSPKMAKAASEKFPEATFEARDILEQPLQEQEFDYIVMNGVLTEKRELSHIEMENYACELIKTAFDSCRCGLAFNVMSHHVDWFRDDLFHWSLDKAVSFLVKKCSRNIITRMDYGLYEYTIYVYRSPNR